MRKRRGEGGAVEVMCLGPLLPSTDPAAALQAKSGEGVWQCMLRGKRIREGEVFGCTISVAGRELLVCVAKERKRESAPREGNPTEF